MQAVSDALQGVPSGGGVYSKATRIRMLPIIFEPEEGDDWLDETVWHKVNPA